MSVNVDSSLWRLAAGLIKYKLMEGFPKITVDTDAAQVEEKYIMHAANLIPFLNLSFPLGIELDEETYRSPPNRPYPGSSAFTTKRVSVEPFPPGKPADPYGTDPQAPAGTYAMFILVSITYTTSPQHEDENDPTTLLEVSADTSGEYLMFPIRGKAHWGAADGDVVQGAQTPVSRIVPETQWSVRWPNINRAFAPKVITSMRNRMGKVNSAKMPVLKGAISETVLFLGYSFTEDFTWREGIENTPVSIDMRFMEKHVKQDNTVVGHNHFFREDTGKFELLFMPDGKKIHEEADLNEMFPPKVVEG